MTLFAFHLFITAGVYLFFPTDSLGTYKFVFDNIDDKKFLLIPGQQFIYYSCYILINYFHLTFISISLVFSCLSFFGFWILHNILQKSGEGYLWLLLFIPSLHLWTVGIGKDALSFLYISILLLGIMKSKFSYIFFALLSLFFVRPHVAIIFGSILILVSLFDVNKNFNYKFSLLFSGLIAAIVGKDYVYIYFNMETLTDIFKFANQMQGQNLYGGSSIPIREYSNLTQAFSFLFRPFFESFNLSFFFASIDNLIYLLIFTWILINYKFIDFKNSINVYLVLAFLIFTLIFGYTIANIGLAMRQKIMIMPFLFIILFNVKNRKALLKNKI